MVQMQAGDSQRDTADGSKEYSQLLMKRLRLRLSLLTLRMKMTTEKTKMKRQEQRYWEEK